MNKKSEKLSPFTVFVFCLEGSVCCSSNDRLSLCPVKTMCSLAEPSLAFWDVALNILKASLIPTSTSFFWWEVLIPHNTYSRSERAKSDRYCFPTSPTVMNSTFFCFSLKQLMKVYIKKKSFHSKLQCNKCQTSAIINLQQQKYLDTDGNRITATEEKCKILLRCFWRRPPRRPAVGGRLPTSSKGWWPAEGKGSNKTGASKTA